MEKITIKEIPVEDRPMEKLVRYGAEYLSDEELLAILIGTGTRDSNAIECADALLKKKFSKNWLLKASIYELREVQGIGTVKACRIIAGLTLGKRLTEKRDFNKISLTDPKTVANYFFNVYSTETREIFCCILLDTKNKPISNEIISIGTLNATLVHPREVFRRAIHAGANSIIVAHNHPSGDPMPSDEDIKLTKRLVDSGKIIGIEILDHIVVGNQKYISMKQHKMM